MKKLYLHIGSPKTGTTSIQKTFFNNREALNGQGYTYPSNKFNDHLLYFATKSPRRDWPRQFKGVKKQALQNSLNEYFQHIEREFKSPDNEQHILSTEYLFLSNPEYISNVIDYLETYFSEINVLVFIRSPEEYYRSMQQQTVKARSYITSPVLFRYDFKKVIKAWRKLCDIEVIEYRRGKDSCIELCNKIGVKFNKLSQAEEKSNASLSIEQMVLLEKIQRNIYPKHEDHFKNHLGVLHRINAPFTTKARLKPSIKKLIYNNHREDLEWLKKEYSIDFLNKEMENGCDSSQEVFNNGKATVRDVYQVDGEHAIDRYESLVIDALLKKLVQSG